MTVSPVTVWDELGPPFIPFDPEEEEEQVMEEGEQVSQGANVTDESEAPPPPDPHPFSS